MRLSQRKRIRMRSALAWNRMFEYSVLLPLYESIRDGRQQQKAAPIATAAVVCLSNDKGNVSTVFKRPIQLPIELVSEQFELVMCSCSFLNDSNEMFVSVRSVL